MTFCHFLEVKFITEAKDFCVFFERSYKVVETKVISIKASWTREIASDFNSATEIDINSLLKTYDRKNKINKIFKLIW